MPIGEHIDLCVKRELPPTQLAIDDKVDSALCLAVRPLFC